MQVKKKKLSKIKSGKKRVEKTTTEKIRDKVAGVVNFFRIFQILIF